MWYKKSIADVFAELQTSRDGLTTAIAQQRLKEYGKNQLPEETQPSLLLIMARQFMSPLIYILMIAAIVAFLSNKLLDSVFIVVVVCVNALLGFYQEWQAEKSSQALKKLIKIEAFVLRNGKQVVISAEELVPGDMVILESGSRIPADIRLIETNNLMIDESLLTGESKSIVKGSEPLIKDAIISERTNMAYASTVVADGEGIGVVVTTGLDTEIGKIASSIVFAKETKTPLLIRMNKFATRISITIFIICAVVFLVGIWQGRPYLELFFLSIALLVSAIPEGLPIAVTAALSRGATRMARRRVIIRRLSAVEALGSCTCIASDKTGTLTLNKQVIEKISLPSSKNFLMADAKDMTKSDDQNVETLVRGKIPDDLKEIITIGTLCNQAALKKDGDKWVQRGDEVDLAFKMFAYKLGIDFELLEKTYAVIQKLPFSTELRYMAATIKSETETFIGIKGAVESILPLCKTMMVNNTSEDLDTQKIETMTQGLTDVGYRVLALAKGAIQDNNAESLQDLIGKNNFTLLGLVGMQDPLRPEAKGAVSKVKRAGVEVIMITGDHPRTAFSIARQLDIVKEFSEVMHGQDFEKMFEAANADQSLKGIKVFARVMPMQKLEIVKLRKRLGDFVAVTGDGINDAPALKEAHLGLAMGSGTEIAKDAALSIITDDNFASIVAGVEEGRTAYANIRKVICLLISAGTAEVFLVLAAVALRLPIPLTTVQILWLNLVTNGLQDVALAFEPSEPFFLSGKLYTLHEGVFNSIMIKQVLLSGLFMGISCFALWAFFLMHEVSIFVARNYLFLFFIVLQNYHALNCKSEYRSLLTTGILSNKILLISIIGAHLLHLACMYLPGISSVLQIEPVSLGTWLTTIAAGSSLILIVEIFKMLQRKKNNLSQFFHQETLDY